ncbi:MAG: hypothetical protein M1828_007188 [Chrysothrix sp. TS-e1954]|nr:MAG: hypothetical protein M1828_007188 [Chrysothrix sp. TS-e1954]
MHIGSLARIGPNHLITSDPRLTRKILATHSRYTRGPWFDSIRIDPYVANIVSERDEKKHDALRYKLSASYTSKNIKMMEPEIDQQLIRWMRIVKQKWLSTPGSARKFDIGKRLKFLTVDIITKVCLSKELGCVVDDCDKFGFLATVQQVNAICQHFSIILELNSLLYFLTKIPGLGSLLTPKAEDKSGVGKILGIIQDLEAEHAKQTKTRHDMLSLYLKKGVPPRQVNAELVVALVAGSDTTSTSVQSTLLAIILHPQVYKRLKAEIHAACNRGRISFPIRQSQAKDLPYLQACILEGLRKFPPLSQLRERVVPPEGDVLLGHKIPGGTFIGLNAWGTQLDSVFGDDAEVFRPERWLDCDEHRLSAMHETHELIFGHGSTKCLGKAMAMMELNKIIFELFRNFDIVIANPYRPWKSVCHGIFFQEDFNVFISAAEPHEADITWHREHIEDKLTTGV